LHEQYGDKDIQTTYAWTIRTLALLGYNLTVLTATIRVWERFKAMDGDIGYFSNMEPSSKIPGAFAQSALHSIENTFVKLEDLREQLLSLIKSCERSKTDVSSQDLF
jgi:hypothetical protein